MLRALGVTAGTAASVGGSRAAVDTGRAQESSGEWTQQAKLVADDGSWFGDAVALDGSTAVVGGRQSGADAGPAFVFEHTDGRWRRAATLVADDEDDEDYQGVSVAVTGSTALVGVPEEESVNGNGPGVGTAHVFERTEGGWRERAELDAADSVGAAGFGGTVALDESTAVVGVVGDGDPDTEVTKSVCVFERVDGRWRRTDGLAASDGTFNDAFGSTAAVDGSTVVVGAPRASDPNGYRSGAVYAFERAGGEWSQRARLVPEDGDEQDGFGAAVAMSDSRVVVGAPGDEDPNGELAGSAYVFERTGGQWTREAKLVPEDGDARDGFGTAVAVDGDRVLVGASDDEDPNGAFAGSSYVFERGEEGWTQRDKLVAADGHCEAVFGDAVALDDSTALVGAYGAENPEVSGTGAVYVFGPSGGSDRGGDGAVESPDRACGDGGGQTGGGGGPGTGGRDTESDGASTDRDRGTAGDRSDPDEGSGGLPDVSTPDLPGPPGVPNLPNLPVLPDIALLGGFGVAMLFALRQRLDARRRVDDAGSSPDADSGPESDTEPDHE